MRKIDFDMNSSTVKWMKNHYAWESGYRLVSRRFFADDTLIIFHINFKGGARFYVVLIPMHVLPSYSPYTTNPRFASERLRRTLELAWHKLSGSKWPKATKNHHGLPLDMGRSKAKIFSYIYKRVWNKINGWKGKLFSMVRKEIIIKPFVQAIPSYIMHCL